MPIQAGTRLGPYEVVALIGAGGMGEVYRARDARLHRDVAIKVLPEGVARDPEQRARFEREAQAVAALSHPNVVAIFDTGAHGDHLYAVTELLTGQTLRERLIAGPIPIGKAIDWAVQVARGLAAAHDKQLVHRDVKPENIFVTADGHVKILDFGLARPAISGKTDANTMSAVTGAGVVLGTAGYMAPEQVRGGLVDAQADLFALGAVLYEMLTGQRAFHRDTAAETMTAILREEPAGVTAVRSDVPPALDRIVRHCLEKDPHERFQSARDVAFALETLSGSSPANSATGTSSVAATVGAGTARPPLRRVISGAVVASALIGSAFWAASYYGLFSRAGTSVAAPIAIGAATQITADDGLEVDAALSPDGKLLAYAAGRATQMRIFIRPVAGGRILTLSEGGTAFEYQPRWSPDGSQILFLTADAVYVASALGGTSRRIAGGDVTSAAWSPDGARILVARARALSVVPVDGGVEREIASGGFELHSCVWAALTDRIACVSGNASVVVPGPTFGNVAPSAIVLVPAAGGTLATAVERKASNLSPAWSPDGRQLYFVSNRDGPRDLFVIEVGQAGPASAPVRVTTGLGVQSMAFASGSGRLVYVAYTARANIWSLPIPTGGPVDTSRAQALTSGTQIVEGVRVSPDRRWLLYDSTLHLNAEIFRMPVAGGTSERLTTDSADDFAPDLSPDGRELAYHSWRSGSRDIYVKPLDGGPLQAVTSSPAQESFPRWSPGGNALTFAEQVRTGSAAIYISTLFVVSRRPGGTWGTPRAIASDASSQSTWLSDDAIAYPSTKGLEAVSLKGGAPRVLYALAPGSAEPVVRSVVLSDDGRTLYFKSVDAENRSTIWALPVAGGKPRLLVRFADPARPSIRPDFSVGAGRLFFTLEDRQADIWVAEVTRR